MRCLRPLVTSVRWCAAQSCMSVNKSTPARRCSFVPFTVLVSPTRPPQGLQRACCSVSERQRSRRAGHRCPSMATTTRSGHGVYRFRAPPPPWGCILRYCGLAAGLFGAFADRIRWPRSAHSTIRRRWQMMHRCASRPLGCASQCGMRGYIFYREANVGWRAAAAVLVPGAPNRKGLGSPLLSRNLSRAGAI